MSTKPGQAQFEDGDIALDRLITEAQAADAAVLIFRSDDSVLTRGSSRPISRDNVILEYGLFLGALGRRRVLILRERGVDLPSDLSGLTTSNFTRCDPKNGLESCAKALRQRKRRGEFKFDARGLGWLQFVVPVEDRRPKARRVDRIQPEIAWFVDKQLEEFGRLAASVRESRDLSIHPATAISFIRMATEKASLVLSVDLELATWSYILEAHDIDNARKRFDAPAERTYHASAHRLDDFTNLYERTIDRLQNGKANLVGPAPAIVRTFVIDRKFLTWEEWAILNKLHAIEKECSFDGRRLMQNRVLFRPEAPQALRGAIRREQDVILFLSAEQRRKREIVKHDEQSPPAGFSSVGIREWISRRDREERITSHALGTESRVKAYRYALQVWQNGSDLDPDRLMGRVQIDSD